MTIRPIKWISLIVGGGVLAFGVLAATHQLRRSHSSGAGGATSVRATSPVVERKTSHETSGRRVQPMVFARPQGLSDALPAEVLALGNMKLDRSSSRLVVTWAQQGAGRAFVARSTNGDTCIILARTNETGAEGCNPGADPFVGRPYFWTSSAEGGPGLSDISSYELVGIVRDDVVRVELTDTSGKSHVGSIGPDRGFAFVFDAVDLHAGTEQMRISAYGKGGEVLGSETVRGD